MRRAVGRFIQRALLEGGIKDGHLTIAIASAVGVLANSNASHSLRVLYRRGRGAGFERGEPRHGGISCQQHLQWAMRIAKHAKSADYTPTQQRGLQPTIGDVLEASDQNWAETTRKFRTAFQLQTQRYVLQARLERALCPSSQRRNVRG